MGKLMNSSLCWLLWIWNFLSENIATWFTLCTWYRHLNLLTCHLWYPCFLGYSFCASHTFWESVGIDELGSLQDTMDHVKHVLSYLTSSQPSVLDSRSVGSSLSLPPHPTSVAEAGIYRHLVLANKCHLKDFEIKGIFALPRPDLALLSAECWFYINVSRLLYACFLTTAVAGIMAKLLHLIHWNPGILAF